MSKSVNIQRIAVSAFFGVNGFLYANWASRLPELQRFFGVNDARLGTLLFTLALGALVSMPFTGWLTAQFGSRRIAYFTGITTGIFILALPLYPNVWLASAVFFLLGMSNGAMDVAMNGQAVYVERQYGRTIMSSFHAVFSLGMAAGAATGGLCAKWHLPLNTHFLAIAVLGIATLLWATRHLIPDEANPANPANADGGDADGGGHFQLPTKAILPLGIIAFCCMTGEGSMADWSAIYMHKVVGSTEAFAAFAVGSFSVAMTIGRIFGDALTLRLGKRNLLIVDSVVAILGLSLALLVPHPWVALGGFFLVGLGLATVVPIVYSTAGNTPGVAPGVGIAMATTIGYSGFFIGPPTIGFLSEQFNLTAGLVFVLVLFGIMAAMVIVAIEPRRMRRYRMSR